MKISLILKLAAAGVCLAWFLSGNHPPAHAQDSLASTVAVHSSDISAINKHLENTDKIEDGLQKQISDNAAQISALEQSQHDWSAILGVLLGGSIVVQVAIRSKKSAG